MSVRTSPPTNRCYRFVFEAEAERTVERTAEDILAEDIPVVDIPVEDILAVDIPVADKRPSDILLVDNLFHYYHPQQRSTN